MFVLPFFSELILASSVCRDTSNFKQSSTSSSVATFKNSLVGETCRESPTIITLTYVFGLPFLLLTVSIGALEATFGMETMVRSEDEFTGHDNSYFLVPFG